MWSSSKWEQHLCKKNYVKCSSSNVCEILKSMENFASCAFSPLALFRETWFAAQFSGCGCTCSDAVGAMYRAHIIHNFFFFFFSPTELHRQRKKKSVISNFLIVIVSFFVLHCIPLWLFFMIYLWNLCLSLYTAQHHIFPHHPTIILLDIQLMFVCTYFIIIIERLFVASSFFFLSTTRCWHESVKNEASKWRSLWVKLNSMEFKHIKKIFELALTHMSKQRSWCDEDLKNPFICYPLQRMQ